MNEHVIDKIILNGFPYEIDRKNEVLLPKEVPRPAISFSAMHKDNGFYIVRINPDGDIVADKERLMPTRIRIPSEVLDTPFIVSDPLLAVFNKNSYSQEWGVLVYDRQIRERLEGKLPEIDIDGDRFIVDWRLKELRMFSDPDKTINLKSLVLSEDGEVYQGYYHTLLRKLADVTIGIRELPRHVVLLEIPNELRLDPVGVAREHGLQSTELLKHFPIEENLKAGIVPLTKTSLPELVQANRKRAELDNSQSQGPKI